MIDDCQDESGTISGSLASIDEAVRLYELGDLRAAEQLLQAMLRKDPAGFDQLLYLGLVKAGQGRADQAIDLIAQAVARAPDKPEGHGKLGAALIASGKYQEGLDECDVSLRLDSEDPETHYERGNALSALGRDGDALAAFERAIELEHDFPAAHLNLGFTRQKLGLLEEAVSALSEAVALKPDYSKALVGLGDLHARLQRQELARLNYRRAVELDPNNAVLHLRIAQLGRQVGERDEALKSLWAAADLDSSNIAILLELVGALTEQGHREEAICRLEQAVERHPDQPRLLVRLAGELCAADRAHEAVGFYRRALSLQPDDVESLNGLGNALLSLRQYQVAADQFRRAIDLQPGLPSLHHNLAHALDSLNQPEDALAGFERAVALDPTLLDARLGAASVLRQLGRFDDANREFEQIIARDSNRIAAYFGLGVSHTFKAGDPLLEILESFCRDRPNLSHDDATLLRFALGKAYADVGDFERSFAHVLEGNRLKRAQIKYEETKVLTYMDRCRSVFTSALMHAKSNWGNDTEVPVFIVGMMRSGSTLVEQILASHPRVFGAGERPHLQTALNTTLKKWRIRSSYPEAVMQFGPQKIRELAAIYLDKLIPLAPECDRITDKLLGNFNYVGLIKLLFPNARIIHTRRDPVDTCLSCFSHLFSAPVPYVYDLAELGRYYSAYARLMAHWREILPEGVMLDVRYEDVTEDLEGQARRIVEHCGLEWDPACLEFHKTERPVRTASVAQVRLPIYSTSVGRGKPLQSMLQPLIEALGTTGTGSFSPKYNDS